MKSSPDFWLQACRELSKKDQILGRLIRSYRGEMLQSRGSAFETLLRSIVGQQISVKAAQTIWGRLEKVVTRITPEHVLNQENEVFRAAGLSNRKVEYVKDLARHFQTRLNDPRRWKSLASMSNEEVIEELIQVKGIGRWTAEMFLIFHLLRPDVFPRADLGLQKAISLAYGKKYPLSERVLLQMEKNFQPWGSVATWYLWRSLDPIPVEY